MVYRYISYIPTKEGFVYLSVIKDLYDNFVVAYKVGTENNNNLVYETGKAAKREVTAELQLHSDQGFQYTSEGYFKLTKSYHITPSMSSPGTPLDNACAENFFSTLKSEWFHRYTPAIKEEARLLLGEYIHLYNYERIQLKTKLTPYEKRCQFQEITSFQEQIKVILRNAFLFRVYCLGFTPPKKHPHFSILGFY